MAALKKDLDEYLLRSESSSSIKIEIPGNFMSNLKPSSWFSKGPAAESNGKVEEAPADWCPSLSRMQRITGFVCCIVMGIICFSMSAFYIPVLLFKARKFALLYTLGSLFMLLSFSFLWGPMNHMRHLFSRERLPFTGIYFGTLLATIYFSMWVQSAPLTCLFAVAQVMALAWFLLSYVPGGQTGIQFFFKLCTSSVSRTLPV
ncbi:hypothetical protein B566_EDAN013379 [Ephemera danica]|nr:hypothetical protein B566_EDAN013379 [Ephemera danica]